MGSADPPLAVHYFYGHRHRQLHRPGTGGRDASAVGDLLAAAPARLAPVQRSVLVRTAVCHQVAQRASHWRSSPGVNTMAGNASKRSAKAAAKRVAAKPPLLAGGNPQIANADGDAPAQAYIAA